MAELKSELKRAFLQSLYDGVSDGTATTDLAADDNSITIAKLEDALKAFQRLGFQALKGGRLSLGSSGLGHEVRWAAPDVGRAFSQEEVFAMAQEFREVYNTAKATLIAAGTANPSDLQILNEMMDDDRLQAVTSTYKDFMGLRYGN